MITSRFNVDSCHSYASGSDNESGGDESYSTSNSMQHEMPTRTEIEESTIDSMLDCLRAPKKLENPVT